MLLPSYPQAPITTLKRTFQFAGNKSEYQQERRRFSWYANGVSGYFVSHFSPSPFSHFPIVAFVSHSKLLAQAVGFRGAKRFFRLGTEFGQ